MPDKNPNTRRYGGPGSSHEDRKHPEKFADEAEKPNQGSPTSGRSSKISGGGGERDKHHSHNPRDKS